MKSFSFFLLSLICLAALTGCNKLDVVEKNVSFPKHEWPGDYQPHVSFNISDTISRYDLFVVIRHTNAYPFSNIWVKINLKSPADSFVIKDLQKELKLADDAQGWFGTGMDDIFEYRVKLGRIAFAHPGHYEAGIQQIMRKDPLPEILNIGFRVEKITNSD